ncbi:hypothetical protein B0H13DRAFT_2283316 [Mycena leptocephala]|nr:hypothetical protein B0H13DRAFT_2283316 [Mycena leptocephala]
MSPNTASQLPNTSRVDAHPGGEIGGVLPEQGELKNAAPSLNAQQQAQLAALLNFKPSSRDVISGIAPHVFDDQRSPYRPRRRRRTSNPDCRRRSRSPAPHRSPLRLSAVLSVDDLGAIVQPRGEDNIVFEVYTAPAHAPPPTSIPLPVVKAMPVSANTHGQNHKPKRFRIDRVLKTLVLRLK